MSEFILKIDKSNRNSLGVVRCRKSLMVAELDQYILLRGTTDSIDLENQLQMLPVLQRFTLDKDGNMFLQNAVTPVETLPELSWQTPETFIPVELPASAMPGIIESTLNIRLAATDKIRQTMALITQLDTWKKYAETAPAVRLDRNRFAVSGNNEVMIMGEPLPSLPGREYWSENDIFLPAGYEFEFPLVTGFLRQKLGVAKGDIILFDEAGQWQRIERNFFVEAKRSAIRLTEPKTN
jgi:hypothetical protein